MTQQSMQLSQMIGNITQMVLNAGISQHSRLNILLYHVPLWLIGKGHLSDKPYIYGSNSDWCS